MGNSGVFSDRYDVCHMPTTLTFLTAGVEMDRTNPKFNRALLYMVSRVISIIQAD